MTQRKYKIWEEMKKEEERERKKELKMLEKYRESEEKRNKTKFHFPRPCGARSKTKRKSKGCGKKFYPKSKHQTLCDECYAMAFALKNQKLKNLKNKGK